MKYLLSILLLLASHSSFAQIIKKPTDMECNPTMAVKYMLWREAGNQNLDTQVLVLRVLENRIKRFKTSACVELFRKGAYPYMKHGVKFVPKSFNKTYAKIIGSTKYKDTKYFYFNHRPHKFGKNTKKIQGLYFSE